MKFNMFSSLPLSYGFMALLFSTLLSTANSAGLDQEAIERGKHLTGACIACHQVNGSGMSIPGAETWPRLAGLDRDYIAAQLKAIKEGTRASPTMAPFASILSEAQMLDVGSYYASLPAVQLPIMKAEKALLDHGEKLANQGDMARGILPCASCHGPGNQGMGSMYPALAGQYPGYITQQLKAWKSGARKNDPANLMGAVAANLDDKDIQAVSAWMANLPIKANQ